MKIRESLADNQMRLADLLDLGAEIQAAENRKQQKAAKTPRLALVK